MGKELGEAAGNDWLPSAISVFAALSAFSAAAKNERERERERERESERWNRKLLCVCNV
jgi:hypothetical protein